MIRFSAFAGAFVLGLALTACGRFFPCGDTVLVESASPDGAFIATVFERDCGATTAKAIHTCLRPRSEPLNSEKHPSFLIFESDKTNSVSWVADRKLVIQLPPGVEVFRQEKRCQGVKVEYLSQVE